MIDLQMIDQKVGLDWSMTSPGLAYTQDGIIHLFGLSKKKKDIGTHKISDTISLVVAPYPEFNNNSERFDKVSSVLVDIISTLNQPSVNLEGYAMGSRGSMAFTIGESTGFLKYKLYSSKVNVHIVSPMTLKKYATGKGNANKDAMMDAFKAKHALETLPNVSCITDVIDAYWLMIYDGPFYEEIV